MEKHWSVLFQECQNIRYISFKKWEDSPNPPTSGTTDSEENRVGYDEVAVGLEKHLKLCISLLLCHQWEGGKGDLKNDTIGFVIFATSTGLLRLIVYLKKQTNLIHE